MDNNRYPMINNIGKWPNKIIITVFYLVKLYQFLFLPRQIDQVIKTIINGSK